ncbi:MAG: hypothetical protein RBT80_11455 [Candidatus Vecturithrix sp.]|jgi:hypothetical protein|nr:hypothetical protein [Candidatus Vecturithrix sp.]
MKPLTLQYRQLSGMLIATPYLDVRLQHEEQSVSVPALVDSGGCSASFRMTLEEN